MGTETTRLGPPRFRLMRQDDNGHRVEMSRFDARPEAEAVRQVFEDRGHKQMYWVEEIETS